MSEQTLERREGGRMEGRRGGNGGREGMEGKIEGREEEEEIRMGRRWRK